MESEACCEGPLGTRSGVSVRWDRDVRAGPGEAPAVWPRPCTPRSPEAGGQLCQVNVGHLSYHLADGSP